jgi:hypothetical protein
LPPFASRSSSIWLGEYMIPPERLCALQARRLAHCIADVIRVQKPAPSLRLVERSTCVTTAEASEAPVSATKRSKTSTSAATMLPAAKHATLALIAAMATFVFVIRAVAKRAKYAWRSEVCSTATMHALPSTCLGGLKVKMGHWHLARIRYFLISNSLAYLLPWQHKEQSQQKSISQ